MKLTARWLCGLFLVALFESLPAGDVAAQQPIALKVASSFAKNSVWETGFFMFVDRVNERVKGRLKLNYVGGPEAIPAFQLIDATRSGVVDISSGVGSYFSSVVPEGDAMKLSQLTPAEERVNGTYALLRKILVQKANVEYLGRVNTPGAHFFFYTVNKVEKMDDFKRLKLRVAPLYRAFALKLGTSPVTMPHSEIFAGLERGVVSGLGFGSIDFTRNGFQKFVRYIVEPHFYSNDQCILVNQAIWQKLPPDLQKLMIEVMLEVERDSAKATQAEAVKERAAMLAAAMQVVQIQDPKRYLSMAYEEGWNEVLQKAPEYGPQLRKLMTKQ